MFKNIINAIKAYFGSFKLMSKLGLWKYFGIPILISFVIGWCYLLMIYFLSSTLGALISKIWIWEWGAQTFATISTYLGGLIIFAVGLILYKHIVMALSSPFMSPVSEKIEKYLLGEEDYVPQQASFTKQLARSIRVNARNLFRELLFLIPLLILSLIPVAGIVGTILIFVIQAYYVGFGNMDYTMERHFNYKDSVRFVRKHRGTAIGNGLIFVFMLFIPILGLIITLPIAVVAASTETVKLLKAEGFLKIEHTKKELLDVEEQPKLEQS